MEVKNILVGLLVRLLLEVFLDDDLSVVNN